jgi:VanZ family protein
MSIFNLLRRWLPAILLMAAIFAFSSIPSTEMPHFGVWDFLVKKGGHAIGYGMLALAYRYALHPNNRRPALAWVGAWLLAVLYSAGDEFHQSFVPGRHPSGLDVLIDAVGAGAALLLAMLYRTKFSRPLAHNAGFHSNSSSKSSSSPKSPSGSI